MNAGSLATYFAAGLEPTWLVGLAPATVTSSSDHAGARSVLSEAWRSTFGREPSPPEIQGAQAIAHFETGYGQFRPFPGSHNWGAVQVPGTWGADTCPANGFLWRDSNPRPDGSDEVRTVCFRTYADDMAGARDLVRNLKHRPKTMKALASGDVDLIATAMYLERYYTGHGATDAERIKHYADGLVARARTIAHALKEPLVVQRGHASSVNDLSLLLPLFGLFGLGVAAIARSRIGEAEPLRSGTPLFTPSIVYSQTIEPVNLASGDILPTFVGPDDARRYIQETDATYVRLDQMIGTSKVPEKFKQGWVVQLKGWRAFRDDALKNAGWLNAKATMEQTDRWSEQAREWHEAYTKQGGEPSGPAPLPPAQGVERVPSQAPGWLQMALLIAALFGLGYAVKNIRGAS